MLKTTYSWSFGLILLIINFNIFAITIGDNVEYDEKSTILSGTVMAISQDQAGKEIVTLKLDGDGREIQSTQTTEKDLKSINDNFTVPNSYSINLMWINKTLNINQQFLSSAQNEEQLKKGLLLPAVKWAITNPTAEVNLWYDGEYATHQALQNTQNILNKLMQEQLIDNIKLKDVREISIVKNNPDVFSDQIPIYFRVDILKPIIIVHSIEDDNNDSAIFTDIKVGDFRDFDDRMTKDELFKPSILKKLNSQGLIMGASGSKNIRGVKGSTENQFFQLVRNPKMIEAIKVAIINANLIRAVSALNDQEYRSLFVPELSRAVYPDVLHDAYAYYDLLSQNKQVLVRPDIIGLGSATDPWVNYDPKKHGYLPFGNIRNPSSRTTIILDHQGKVIGRGKVSNLNFELDGPSRNVDGKEGSDHDEAWSNLVHRFPADGGDTYHVQLWE